MSKKSMTIEEIQNEQLTEFIKEMQDVGVKDKTIKLVLKDIHEYQEKIIREQLENVFVQMQKTIKKALEEKNE
jgi:hypothetical protein